MKDKYEVLQKAAEAATPGPWKASGVSVSHAYLHECANGDRITVNPYFALHTTGSWGSKAQREKDAAYIALSNPAAILELLSELRSKEVMPLEGCNHTGLFATPPTMALTGNGLDRANLSELRGVERGGEGQKYQSFNQWFAKFHPETDKAAWSEKNDPKYANASHGNTATKERLCECWNASRATLSVTEGVDGWIDCKQELPPMGKLVIVAAGRIVQNCMYSCNEIDQCWSPFDEDFDCAPLDEFTHWMPLPKPPQSGVDGWEK